MSYKQLSKRATQLRTEYQNILHRLRAIDRELTELKDISSAAFGIETELKDSRAALLDLRPELEIAVKLGKRGQL